MFDTSGGPPEVLPPDGMNHTHSEWTIIPSAANRTAPYRQAAPAKQSDRQISRAACAPLRERIYSSLTSFRANMQCYVRCGSRAIQYYWNRPDSFACILYLPAVIEGTLAE